MSKFTQSIRSKITAGVAATLVSTLFVVAAIGACMLIFAYRAIRGRAT